MSCKPSIYLSRAYNSIEACTLAMENINKFSETTYKLIYVYSEGPVQFIYGNLDSYYTCVFKEGSKDSLLRLHLKYVADLEVRKVKGYPYKYLKEKTC